MKKPLLTLKNLSVGYNKSVVCKDISLEVFPGDFISIVGANGSGKSTLIKTVLGLLPLISGKILWREAVKVGYLPQETRLENNFPATVSEIVRAGTLGTLKFRPFYGEKERRIAETALKTLGIKKLAKKSFAELSGGQRQKVLLARALVATMTDDSEKSFKTALLMLDEPSNNLDYSSRIDFYRTLARLNHEKGLTILMITHDLDADDLIGSHVLALKEGVAMLYDTTDYLQHYHPTHARLDQGEKK